MVGGGAWKRFDKERRLQSSRERRRRVVEPLVVPDDSDAVAVDSGVAVSGSSASRWEYSSLSDGAMLAESGCLDADRCGFTTDDDTCCCRWALMAMRI